ncbi:hypothetical protein ACFV20_19535 [Streptomyces sp. NPDC059696]|uniref:hypothetical protein n=1 Tax=Streptomyces sp. NPDC059696 TaxID=3346911 RepID=UPI0036A4D394
MTVTTDAGATTAPAAEPTGRPARLINAIRAQGGRWTTNRAFKTYRHLPALAGMPLGQIRVVARGDLRDLAAWGWLVAHDDTGRREYSLNHRKDVRS